MGRLCSGDKNCADNKVSTYHSLFNIIGIGCRGLCPAAEDIVQIAQPLKAPVHNDNLCPHAQSHLSGICPHNTAAYDYNLPSFNPWHSAKQDTPSTVRSHKIVCANLHGYLACDLAHGRKYGKTSVFEFNCFVGNGNDIALYQSRNQFRQRCKVKELISALIKSN